MKVRNEDQSAYDAGGNQAPWLFYGSGVPDTTRRFCDAPLCSLYWDVTNYYIYVKTANTAAAADWKPIVAAGRTTIGNTVITGDLTVSGTITGGDITAAAS